jgi:hypothetical protein
VILSLHQIEALGEIGRHALRLLYVRIDLRIVLLGLFNLALDLADRRQILVELAPVGRAKPDCSFFMSRRQG